MAQPDLIVRTLRLWFKGQRTYLHATNLFDALIEASGAASEPDVTDVRFSIYKPMSQVVEAVSGPVGWRCDFRSSAVLEFSSGAKRVVWALREKSGEPVLERRPYPEDLVLADARVEGDAIIQVKPSPYSFVERVAALNKHLLNRTIEGSRGWWFSRLEIAALPGSGPALRLEKATELSRRLIKSRIYADDSLFGFVYFTERTD